VEHFYLYDHKSADNASDALRPYLDRCAPLLSGDSQEILLRNPTALGRIPGVLLAPRPARAEFGL
jgi:hypothetical protein